VTGSAENTAQPLAPAVTTCAVRPLVVMASPMPVAARWRRRSILSYASGVATSVSMARVAAMASGFPLKVPTMS
jgi:hypothetical protein